MRFLLHTNIVYALRVCHDIDQIFFGHGQCHWQKNHRIRVRSNSFLWRNIGNSYFTQILFMTLGCVNNLTQCHFSMFKVIGRKVYICVCFVLMEKSTGNCYFISYDQRMCHVLYPESMGKYKVIVQKMLNLLIGNILLLKMIRS